MNKSLIFTALALALVGCAGHPDETAYTEHYYTQHPGAMKKIVEKCDAMNHQPTGALLNNCAAASNAEAFLIQEKADDRVLNDPNGD